MIGMNWIYQIKLFWKMINGLRASAIKTNSLRGVIIRMAQADDLFKTENKE